MKKVKSFIALLLSTTLAFSSVAYGATLPKKEETVYVTLTPTGSNKETIVSNWIHREDTSQPIQDFSSLKEITNVKGEEQPEQKGEDLIWNTDKEDLFYQGKTDKELPLSVQIQYFLDNQEIAPEELGGKNGHLKIKLEIQNNENHQKTVQGKSRKVFTPFAVAVAMNFPLDTFQNIQSNTGKIISDGTRKMGVFTIFPGMKESFEKQPNFIDLPDFIEVTADVENFEMGPIFITATSNIPNLDQLDKIKDLDELIDGIDQLQEASKQLAEGTDTLAEGQHLLYENLVKFTDGFKKYSQGSDQLLHGIDQLHQGSIQAKEGATQVANGLKAFDANMDQWSQGATQWSAGALEYGKQSTEFAKGALAVSQGTQEIVTASQQLSKGVNELTSGTEQLIQGQNQISKGMMESIEGIQSLKAGKEKEQKVVSLLLEGTERLNQAVSVLDKIPGTTGIVEKLREGLNKQQSTLLQLQKANEQSLQGFIALEQGLQQLQAGSVQMAEKLGELQQGQNQVAQGLNALGEGTKSLEPAAKQLMEGSQGLATGAAKLQESGTPLMEGAKGLKKGSLALTNGAQEVANGVTQLTKGTEELNAGAKQLKEGKEALDHGSTQLVDGAEKLAEGTEELKEHMHEFYEEGTKKLHDEVSSSLDDVDEVLEMKDVLVDLSKEYRSFSGTAENMDSSVSFVMRTEEIKRPEIKKQMVLPLEEKENTSSSFLEKLFSFFKKSK